MAVSLAGEPGVAHARPLRDDPVASGPRPDSPGRAHWIVEVVGMTSMTHIKAKITPWDDQEFVRAFESARDQTAREELGDGPKAGAHVEHLLREAGYPKARVDVIQTVRDALEQTSHWVVSRDG
jgi:hypothetical protein